MFVAIDAFAQNVDETNRLRQRPGSFLEITRLLPQAVLYQIDSSRTIWTSWERPEYKQRFAR